MPVEWVPCSFPPPFGLIWKPKIPEGSHRFPRAGPPRRFWPRAKPSGRLGAQNHGAFQPYPRSFPGVTSPDLLGPDGAAPSLSLGPSVPRDSPTPRLLSSDPTDAASLCLLHPHRRWSSPGNECRCFWSSSSRRRPSLFSRQEDPIASPSSCLRPGAAVQPPSRCRRPASVQAPLSCLRSGAAVLFPSRRYCMWVLLSYYI
jgi:hypothetical protein